MMTFYVLLLGFIFSGCFCGVGNSARSATIPEPAGLPNEQLSHDQLQQLR